MTDNIKNIAVTLGACVTIFTGTWFFAAPAVDNYIKNLIKTYVNSPEYIIQEKEISKVVAKEIFEQFINSKSFEEKLEEYLDRVNSNSVSLRKLLSIKMGVPQETVADELARLYTKDSKRLRNILRWISSNYPELNVWEIQNN